MIAALEAAAAALAARWGIEAELQRGREEYPHLTFRIGEVEVAVYALRCPAGADAPPVYDVHLASGDASLQIGDEDADVCKLLTRMLCRERSIAIRFAGVLDDALAELDDTDTTKAKP